MKDQTAMITVFPRICPTLAGAWKQVAAAAALLLPGPSLAQTTSGNERERVFSQYATLKTIAGASQEQDGNFWRPEFEGADATVVELSNPHMTMADAAGNLYIADKESHSVLRVDSGGRIHTHAGTHEAGHNGDEGPAREIQLDNPNGLFVHPDGTVYILDTVNRRVRKVDRAGQLTTLFHDPKGFGPGRGLWVSADESLVYYNGSNRVKRWTPDGGVETVVPSIADPGNLTVDPNGALVVTSRGDHLVYRVGEAGELTVIAGDGSEDEADADGVPATAVGLAAVRGVAFLPDGGFFVATMKGGDIWYVDGQGMIHRFLSGTGSGNVLAGEGERFSTPGDKLSEPRAITLAPNGDIILTSNDRGVIRVVERFQSPRLEMRIEGSAGGAGGAILRGSVQVTPGRSHTIERSPDLVDWEVWRILEPESSGAELPSFGAARGFYRVRW